MKLEIGLCYTDNCDNEWIVESELKNGNGFVLVYHCEAKIRHERLCSESGIFLMCNSRYIVCESGTVPTPIKHIPSEYDLKPRRCPKVKTRIRADADDGAPQFVCDIKGVHAFTFTLRGMTPEHAGWLFGILHDNIATVAENAYAAGRASVIHNIREIMI